MTTGGTIASANTPYGLIPKLTSEELLSYLPAIDQDIEIVTEELYSIDSTNATPEHWKIIEKAIKDNYHYYDGFVLCHGTDTMAYTAAALSYMIQDSPKPIVITGAQKPIGMEITDAKTNLRDSIVYAADEKSCGVQIVFDGKVILGTRAKKTRTLSFSAFSSINYPFIAEIFDGRIVRFIEQKKDMMSVRFYENLSDKVFLLKLTPGVLPEIIPRIFELYDGVIIESFGTGGIPNSIQDAVFACLDKYEAGEKVLVMATQVQYEGSHVDVYEVGRKIMSKYKILEAGDMTLEAAFTKLMWTLENRGGSWEEIKEAYQKPVSFDRL